MEIERDKLLSELRTVQGGLAAKETIEQSTCFVFRKGHVITYNDEVACHGPCSLSFTGAISARKMLDMLSRWNEDTITFNRTAGRLQFKGKSKRGYFRTQDTITLPVKEIEHPQKWRPLPKDFLTSVALVRECACRAAESPHLSCVHFSPKWIEACDGVQAGRVLMKTGFEKSVLIRAEAMGYVVNGIVTEIGETANWAHFRNKSGLVISCHKCFEDYPSKRLTKFFGTKGEVTTLPQLRQLVDRLSVFLDDTNKSPWLEVEITRGRLQITGKGEHGSQTERQKIDYSGKPLAFCINAMLLRNLSDKHDKCEVSKKVIQIRKKNFQYLSSVWVPNEKGAKEKSKGQ